VLQARLDAHDQDPSSAVSWEQVRSKLLKLPTGSGLTRRWARRRL
jgi:hypothetical protein